MTAQDRGAYTPQTDAPLAFDARAPRGARKPLPMALIGGVVVLVALIAAVVLYYRNGVRPAAGVPPVAGDPVVAVKTPPSAAAVAKDRDDDPFSSLDSGGIAQNVPAKAPEFAPAPEQPKPRPAPGLTVQTVDSSPLHAVPTTTALPVKAAPTAPVAPAKTLPVAAAAPIPLAVSAPAPTPTPVKPVAIQPAAPVATARAPASSPDAAAPATPSVSGPAAVQIGAYSSAALADKGYQDVASAFATFMGGKAKRVEPLSRDGKMLYRTSVSGFASKSSAQAFCAALKASGRVCLVKS